MTEATVRRVRSEDALPRSRETDAAVRERSIHVRSRLPALLWAGIVVAIVGFVAFGSLQVGAGNNFGRRMSVRESWSRFLGFLIDQGASPAIVGIVTAAVAIALLGAAYALWLALHLEDQQPDPPSGDQTGQ